jgi:uncharacterized phage-associated protein
MPVSAHDVADELRRRLPGLGAVKLHKLLYFAQGWHLARTGEPMFGEAIKAWANGPVVAELWADERYERARPARQPLDPASLVTIEYVVDRYGQPSGTELIRLTHLEDPWRTVSESDDPTPTADPEISHEALRRWFTQDDQYVGHRVEVERLRQRRDVYSFEPIERTPHLEAAVARAVHATAVRHSRPE